MKDPKDMTEEELERSVVEAAMRAWATRMSFCDAVRHKLRLDSRFRTQERARVRFERACSALHDFRSTPPGGAK